MNLKKLRLAVIGLGYVGLPLAVEFSKKRKVIGYDISQTRIKELISGFDKTLEINNGKFESNKNLDIVNKIANIKNCNCYILTVPTPINNKNKPDLTLLLRATKEIGKILKKNDIVIYESTVYPGCTEEKCVPLLEKISGLEFNKEFFCGYSPERINPGDKKHKIKDIKKVVSGSNRKITNIVDKLYSEIITAGTYKASSIKVAEAAKVIENSQRDINIAFVNELSKIFNILEIDTNEVLDAACTKWNFLDFRPGLVGGHCIGVDPYYLAEKSLSHGYNPEIILSGRRLNDSMGKYVSNQLIKLMKSKKIKINKSQILILGFTFKENCPDYRNTKVIDIFRELKTHTNKVDIVDPWINIKSFKNEFNLKIHNIIPNKRYDGIVLAVSHQEFKKFDPNQFLNDTGVVYDLKGFFNKNKVDLRL